MLKALYIPPRPFWSSPGIYPLVDVKDGLTLPYKPQTPELAYPLPATMEVITSTTSDFPETPRGTSENYLEFI